MRTGLLVGDVMTQRPICVPENITVRQASLIMRDKNVGSVLVTDEDELLGILTEHDILHKISAEGLKSDDVQVKDVMTDAFVIAAPNHDVLHAITLMKDHDVRHVPVLEDEKLIGFLTLKDILKIEPQLFELYLDNIELREEERKLQLRPESSAREGFCEICGNFSSKLSHGEDHRFMCEDCVEE